MALCESGGRQSARGPYGEIGLLQIHPKYHLKRARSLGYDIYSGTGNMAYGMLLYQENGLRDWYATKHCWSYKTLASR